MNYFFVYITTANRQEAETISEAIIQNRLVACTNIIDGMSSLFHWEGAVQSEQESVLIVKTTTSAYPRLEAKIKELHSYDCPCIVALPIASGNPDYLKWIDEEVRPKHSA